MQIQSFLHEMSDSLHDACVSEAPVEGENQVQVHEIRFYSSGFNMLLAEISKSNNKTKQVCFVGIFSSS